MLVLLLGMLSLVPTVVALVKKGDPRFIAMALGIVVAAFVFSLAGTGMGLYEMSKMAKQDEISVSLFCRGLGISMVPMTFGAIFFGLNAFLLGLARFLRRN